jgi:hypothetical protein
MTETDVEAMAQDLGLGSAGGASGPSGDDAGDTAVDDVRTDLLGEIDSAGGALIEGSPRRRAAEV